MKRIFKVISLLFLFGVCLQILSKIGQNIPEVNAPILHQPEIKERKDIKIHFIRTGTFETLEGFLYAGGSFLRLQNGAHNSTLIQHPKGSVLIDTGLGKNVDLQFEEMPILLKPLFGYKKNLSAREQLDEKNISVSNIILTHMHWDHASGLKDFGEPVVYTTKEEFEFGNGIYGKPPAYIKSQYDGLKNFRFLSFSDGPYEIYEASFDFFKDGSLVLVPLSGHSPGSIGIFVNLAKDKRYFFSGDLTWAEAGLLHQSHKFIVSSLLVDDHRSDVGKEIGRLSSLMKRKPEIKIIPAHDAEAYQVLPPL